MALQTGRQRQFPAVAIAAVLLLICLIPGQSWVTSFFPGISGLAGINPSLVILDIHIPLPFRIDLVLVPVLFILMYTIIVLLFPSRPGIPVWRQAMQRVGAVLTGSFVLLLCLLSGGLLYYLIQAHLPREVRKGIDSFGINADIHLPYPGYETIPLRGSFILLLCLIIGLSIAIRKIRKEPGMPKARPLTRDQRMTPYQRVKQEQRLKGSSAPTSAKPVTTRKPTGIEPGSTRKPAGIPPGTTRDDRYALSRLCRIQPVVTVKPEAVNYMPMS